MEWKIKVPIFKDVTILKQLGIAVGIPFGIVVFVIAATSGRSVYTLYSLGLIGALLLLSWAFIMAVYGGKYEVEFILNDEGVLCRTQAKQAEKNRVINTLTVAAGLLSGKPAVAGAGLLAGARQSVYLKWNRVTRIKYCPGRRTILLRGGWTENIGLFCTKENYQEVEAFVRQKCLKAK
jgi:hypothetical protein